MANLSSPRESLLLFSDVHLGSDLQDCAAKTRRRPVAIDRDLVALLRHYRQEPVPADRWRIVIAGDFIDFIGMSIAADDAAPHAPLTKLTAEERLHGLGSAEDHARLKLARVAARHADVLEALAAFVADGHALTLVHGNHDIEFHWDGVKSDFRAILFDLVKTSAEHDRGGAEIDRESFDSRIEFRPWFFYRDGVAYVEHGHQYDPFCATTNVMTPLSPYDPRRVARGFSDTLLRYVVRPTRGMSENGHDSVGIAYYLRFGAQLGIRGMVGLGVRFTRAVVELFRLRREDLSEAAHALRAEHDRRVTQLGEATRIGVDRLRALLRLQARPITSSVRGILGSVLLDRLALALTMLLAIAFLAIFSVFHPYALAALVAVPIAWTLGHRYLSKQRQVDPTAALAERATQLATLFPAAFVVMGHTHVAASLPAGDATYINLGSWAEDEAAGDEPEHEEPVRAARAHVVIHVKDEGPEARFYTWEETGAEEFTPARG